MRSLLIGGLGGCLICTAFVASAQEAGNASAPSNDPGTIGPPQLRDFRLQPQERIVAQPPPTAPAPVVVEPPPPTSTAPRQAPPQQTGSRAATPVPSQTSRTVQTRNEPNPAAPPPLPEQIPAAPTFEAAPTPAPAPEAIPAAPAAEEEGTAYWLYAIPVVALILLGFAFARRHRRSEAAGPVAESAPIAAPPPSRPRVDPVPRPWLELELKTERASFTPTEAVIQFELSVRNTGKSQARNLRIDVKIFNAGREQDQEIGAFFKTAGRESTKLSLPGIGGESTGVIRGEVAMPREEMRAVKLDDRLLFIPVVAVNVLYDWGEERTGQTSKSYVVGRELQEQSDKMGAFRVDQGPRIWRTIGQRPHKVAKRV